MNLGITGFEHVAVQVADLERSLAFYTATLGLTLRERSEIPQRGLRKALIAVGTGQIELLEYQDKAVPAADGPVAHLALTVTDIAAALAALKRAGVRLEDEAPRAVGVAARLRFYGARTANTLSCSNPSGRKDLAISPLFPVGRFFWRAGIGAVRHESIRARRKLL